MTVLRNDAWNVHEVNIVPPPEMQHIYLQDVLLRDRLNEDIDLQDVLPKTTHI